MRDGGTARRSRVDISSAPARYPYAYAIMAYMRAAGWVPPSILRIREDGGMEGAAPERRAHASLSFK